MLYESYKRKVETAGTVLRILRNLLPVFIVLLSLVTVSTLSFVAVQGMVIGDSDCPDTIVYGEELNYSASAMFREVKYQYSSTKDFKEISDTPPILPGEYYVRAVSKSFFGGKRYGDVHSFTVSKLPTNVNVTSSTIVYGDLPSVNAELEYGDTISCSGFIYENVANETTSVHADVNKIVILDKNGNDVTRAYELATPDSQITFMKRDVTITLGNGTEIYDGQPFTFKDWQVTSGSFAALNGSNQDQFRPVFSPSSTIPGVGTTTGTLESYTVISPENINVTDRYRITVIDGAITINKRPITLEITNENASFTYDGTSHSNTEFKVSDDTPLADGHSIELIEFTELTNVGTVENILEFKILDANGEDVTDNYDITIPSAYITVTKKDIEFTSPNGEWTYDGYIHSVDNTDEYIISDGSLAAGHTFTVKVLTSVTSQGTYDNVFSVTVLNANGEDVTDNYNVTMVNGVLTVNKRVISVTTHTNIDFIYNGKNQYVNTWDITSGSLADAQFALINENGYPTVKDVKDGEIDNIFRLIIKDATGNDVTENYDISYIYGKIKVNKRPISVLTNSMTWEYDGKDHSDDGWSIIGTYGIVDGEEFSTVGVKSIRNYTDGGILNEFSILVLRDGIDNSDNYDITYQYGIVTIEKRKLSILTATNTDSLIYNGEYQFDNTWTAISNTIADGQIAEAVGYPSLRDVLEGSCSNVFDLIIYDENKEDVTSNYDITYTYGTICIVPRPISILTATASWVYDGQRHFSDEWSYNNSKYQIVGGETSEAIGVPSILDCIEGEIQNEFTLNILRGGESNNSNYDITYQYGTISIAQRKILIDTAPGSWTYDGEYHYNNSWTLSSSSEHDILSGETVITSSYTSVRDYNGDGEDNIITLAVFRNGEDISFNYDIKCIAGKLSITKRPISVLTASDHWIYDGEEHSNGTWYYNNSEYEIVIGEAPVITQAATVRDYMQGNVLNEFTISIFRDGDNIDKNYEITYEYGTISIGKRSISIETPSDSWVYSGYDLSNTDWYYSSSTLYNIVSSDISYATEVTVIRNVGTADNKFVLNMTGDDGRDVTENYDIEYAYGVLEVVKRQIHVITDTNLDGLFYNGDYQNDTGITARGINSDPAICSMHKATAVGYPSVRDVLDGETDNIFSIIITDENGENVTSNYEITYEYGKIKINPRPVTVTTPSNSWTYDGQSHYDDNWHTDFSVYDIVEDRDSVVITTPPSVLDVMDGIVPNEFTLTIFRDGIDISENYDFKYDFGSIWINKREVWIETPDAEWKYDGEWHSNTNWNIMESTPNYIVEGEEIIMIDFKIVRDYVESGDNIIDHAIYRNGSNITENYDLIYYYGILTIQKREIYVTTPDGKWVYDGNFHSKTEWEYDESSPDYIVANELSKVENETEIRDYKDGGVDNVLPIIIYRYNDETHEYDNISDNYAITCTKYGTLEIEKRTVSVVLPTTSWKYDGEWHSDTDWQYNNSVYDIVDGEICDYVGVPAVRDVKDGVIENVFTISIYRNNENIDHNYTFEYVSGSISIEKLIVSIVTDSATWKYDGEAHSLPAWTYAAYTQNELAAPDTWEALNAPSITNYYDAINGTIVNEFSIAVYGIRYGETANVTDNYVINYEYGTLSITKRILNVNTASQEWIYDGRYHSLADFEYLEGSDTVADGQIIYSNDASSIKDVGSVSNEFTFIITDKDNNDVMGNYEITLNGYGTLTVNKRPIKVVTATDSWMYDGKAHANVTLTTTPDSAYSVVDIHRVVSENYPTVTYVKDGTVNNIFDFIIVDEEGKDVTSNYDIDLVGYGTISITPRNVTIVTATHTWTYDGQTHFDNGYTVSDLNFVDGDIVTVLSSAIIGPLPEKAENVFSGISILRDGADMSDNYTIDYINGVIEIERFRIFLTAQSASKEYDGTPLTCPEFFIFDGELQEGHEIKEITIEGSITDPGNAPNIIVEGSVRIFYGDVDVTDCYEIILGQGSLTILDGDDDSSGGGGDGGPGEGGDGGPGEGGDITPDGGEGNGPGGNLDTSGNINGDGNNSAQNRDPLGNDLFPVVSLFSDINGKVYLKLMSYGDYNGTMFLPANEYPELLDGIYSYNYISNTALSSAGLSPHLLMIKSNTSDYLLPSYMTPDGSYIVQTSDVKYEGQHSGMYSVMYYGYYGYAKGFVIDLGEYSDEELAYREFVRNNYLSIDDDTLAFMNSLIAENGWSATDADIVSKIAEYIQNSATYNKEYDTALDSESNIVTAFLGTYKEGVCRHYAASATMLYRALGIPARYTIGYSASTSENKWVEVSSKQAHAWVEVYIDGFGWLTVEVTGSGAGDGDSGDAPSDDNNGMDLPSSITVKPTDVIVEYDGNAHYAKNEIEVSYASNIEALLNLGYKYVVNVSGERTEIGTSYSTITLFTLYDPNGNDVTAEFDITYNSGKIEVTKPQIVIQLYEVSKEYDGTPLEYYPDDYFITKIPDGHTLQFELKGNMTEAGEYDISLLYLLPYKVFDGDGNDVTDSYFLKIEGEGMKVLRKRITITAESENKEYDGVELSNKNYHITMGSLVSGHILKVTTSGKITDVGQTANKISYYSITDKNGNDLTNSYKVTTVQGVLTVSPEKQNQ